MQPTRAFLTYLLIQRSLAGLAAQTLPYFKNEAQTASIYVVLSYLHSPPSSLSLYLQTFL